MKVRNLVPHDNSNAVKFPTKGEYSISQGEILQYFLPHTSGTFFPLRYGQLRRDIIITTRHYCEQNSLSSRRILVLAQATGLADGSSVPTSSTLRTIETVHSSSSAPCPFCMGAHEEHHLQGLEVRMLNLLNFIQQKGVEIGELLLFTSTVKISTGRDDGKMYFSSAEVDQPI